VNLTEMAPAVLIDELALVVERIRPLDSLADERSVAGLECRQTVNGARGNHPRWIDNDNRGPHTPMECGQLEPGTNLDPAAMRLLLPALQLVAICVLPGKKPQHERRIPGLDRARKVLPELRQRHGN